MCTFLAADKPKLTELQQFTKSDGSVVNILKRIAAADYSDFGTCLLRDDDGSKMAIIQKNQNSVEDRVRQIVVHWLAGMFKETQVKLTYNSGCIIGRFV